MGNVPGSAENAAADMKQLSSGEVETQTPLTLPTVSVDLVCDMAIDNASPLDSPVVTSEGEPPTLPTAACGADIGDDSDSNQPCTASSSDEHFIAGLRIPVSSDSAFKVKFLETVVAGWPKSDPSESVIESRGNIFAWSRTAILSDVWAVRRVVLDLLRVLESDGAYVLTTWDVAVIVDAVTAGSSDRNSKVRLASLQCLSTLINVHCELRGVYNVLSDQGMEGVRAALRRAAEDTEPAVLQACAKLQADWLHVSSSLKKPSSN